MELWIAIAVMTAVAALGLMAPLWRRRSDEAAGPGDVAVYRDMLAELERDKAAGLMPEAEAAAARAEIGRRLLRADREADRSVGRSVGARKVFIVAALIILPVLSLSIYRQVGSPGAPDMPIAARKAADGDGQSIEDLVARVEKRLAANPDDGRGWEVVAPVYFRLGRADDAVRAMRNVIRLLGENSVRLQQLGEALTLAAGGQVTPEARDAFQKVADAEPDAVAPRMYLALGLSQQGHKDESIAAWQALVDRAKGDEPWLQVARDQLTELKGEPAQAPGPSADQQQMIEGMVSGLAERLKANGGTADEWTRLIRSYVVLKKPDEARKALAAANENLKDDAAGRAAVADAARKLGLTE